MLALEEGFELGGGGGAFHRALAGDGEGAGGVGEAEGLRRGGAAQPVGDEGGGEGVAGAGGVDLLDGEGGRRRACRGRRGGGAGGAVA